MYWGRKRGRCNTFATSLLNFNTACTKLSEWKRDIWKIMRVSEKGRELIIVGFRMAKQVQINGDLIGGQIYRSFIVSIYYCHG